MQIADQPATWRPVAWIIAALLAASMSVVDASPAAAASCFDTSHTSTLRNGSASPGSGAESTTFDFVVVYADDTRCRPSSVTLVVPGVGQFAMSGSGWRWRTGVTFRVSTDLPPGTHGYSFAATSGSGAGVETVTLSTVSPGSVVVQPDPTPTPAPTVKPTPKPTAKPKPKATAKPKPKATARPKPKATARPKPVATPRAASVSTATPGSTPSPDATVSLIPSARPTASPTPRAIAIVPAPLDPGGHAGGASDLPPATGGGLGGPMNGTLLLSLLLTTSSAAVGVGLFAFLVARPRRRMALVAPAPLALLEAPRSVALLEAVSGVAPVALLDAADPAPSAEAPLTALAAAALPETPVQEMAMPRWRRPSVQAARKASTRDIPDHVPLVFAAPAASAERRAVVNYRLVRVYDQPDEVRGTEVDWLDRGDEVDVISEQGRYVFVQTPNGAAGYVHRTTLKILDPAKSTDDWMNDSMGSGEEEPPAWSVTG